MKISDYQHNPDKPVLFEHACCTRCGGGGRFGPACVYSGICFKCGGKGYTLTGRGAVAHAAYADSLRTPASEVRVGDKVRVEGIPGIEGSYWLAVTEVERETVDGGRYRVGGPDAEWVERGPVERVTLKGLRRRPGCTWDDENGTEASGYGVDADMRVRIERVPAFKQARLAEALALQATLTKAGLTPEEAAAKREERRAARAARPMDVAEARSLAGQVDGPVTSGQPVPEPEIADDARLMARMLGQ